MSDPMRGLSGLYAITDTVLTPHERLIESVEKAVVGGARIVQLRDKDTSDDVLLPMAMEVRDICLRHGALFIVNDRVRLALDADAGGLHIGRDDLPVEEVRRLLGPGRIIGVSCYGDLDRAADMERRGADYVAFGSFFPSPTKPAAPAIPPEVLSFAKRRLAVPVCAIGGITVENAAGLVAAGADMLAVISDLWKAPDIRNRAAEYAGLFEHVSRSGCRPG